MKRLSALGARESVLEYWHKIVVCSHLQGPIYFCVHSYSISRCQISFWNMSLEPSTKKWTASELWTKTICRRIRCPLLCPISSVGTWENGVFTLVPSEYRTRPSCPGTKCECCQRYHKQCTRVRENVSAVQKVDNATHVENLYPVQLVSSILLRWIVIYPVNIAIYRLNNRAPNSSRFALELLSTYCKRISSW